MVKMAFSVFRLLSLFRHYVHKVLAQGDPNEVVVLGLIKAHGPAQLNHSNAGLTNDTSVSKCFYIINRLCSHLQQFECYTT